MKKQAQLKTPRDIDVVMLINTLKSVRERVHVADVVVTSSRAPEVLHGISDLLNDACADLDELTDKWEPILKSIKKAA